jgi:hypothetical protein
LNTAKFFFKISAPKIGSPILIAAIFLF